MIRYYRIEIIYRVEEYHIDNIKYKAPFQLKKTVLLCFISVITNYLMFFIIGTDMLILHNSGPVICFMFIIWRYRRKIKKIDLNEVE